MQIQSATSTDSEEIIRDFLYAHYSGVLATTDAEGNPYAATVYFAADDDLSITFATKTETQKYKNILQNNHVAFVCFDEDTQTAVQIVGKVEKVLDPKEHQKMLNNIYRFSETVGKVELPPIEKLFAGDYVTLRIFPQFIKMGIFMRPDAESNEELYETITFEPNK